MCTQREDDFVSTSTLTCFSIFFLFRWKRNDTQIRRNSTITRGRESVSESVSRVPERDRVEEGIQQQRMHVRTYICMYVCMYARKMDDDGVRRPVVQDLRGQSRSVSLVSKITWPVIRVYDTKRGTREVTATKESRIAQLFARICMYVRTYVQSTCRFDPCEETMQTQISVLKSPSIGKTRHVAFDWRERLGSFVTARRNRCVVLPRPVLSLLPCPFLRRIENRERFVDVIAVFRFLF